jgi:DNA-binding protein Fis
MTQEEKRIKLAEAGGWKRIPAETVGAAAKLFYGDIWWRDAENNTIACADQLPDYFNNLNAVHELEQWMFQSYETLEGAERLSLYTKLLCKLEHPLFATAAQRCEAIGLTLKLWK